MLDPRRVTLYRPRTSLCRQCEVGDAEQVGANVSRRLSAARSSHSIFNIQSSSLLINLFYRSGYIPIIQSARHHVFGRHFFFFTLNLNSASRTPHLVQWISICLLFLNTSDQSFLEVCLKQNQNHQKSLLRLRKHTLPSYKPNTRNFRLCRFPIQTRQGFACPLAPPQDASFAWLSLMETQSTWP